MGIAPPTFKLNPLLQELLYQFELNLPHTIILIFLCYIVKAGEIRVQPRLLSIRHTFKFPLTTSSYSTNEDIGIKICRNRAFKLFRLPFKKSEYNFLSPRYRKWRPQCLYLNFYRKYCSINIIEFQNEYLPENTVLLYTVLFLSSHTPNIKINELLVDFIAYIPINL